MIFELLLSVGALVAFLLWSYVPRWYQLLKYKLPPGPVCLPFLGYLPILDKETGHIVARKLTEKYGNVVSIYIGNRLVVILDNFQSLKAAFNKEELLDRPEKVLELEDDQHSVTDLNGELWKQHRRFLVTCLRQLTTGNKDFESIIMEYVLEACSSIRPSRSQEVRLDEMIEFVTHNIAYRLIYGKKFESSHPMMSLLSEYHEAIEVHVLHNIVRLFLPPAAFLMQFTPKVKAAREVLKLMDNVIRKEVQEHQETLNTSEPRDIVDYFLLNIRKPGMDDCFNMSSLLGTVKELLVASSETTKPSLVWFFLLMAKHQDVQKNIQSEIDTTLGRDREPRTSDRRKLPYTEAAIWESMRLMYIANWNLMRSTSKDTTLCGFDIPKGTVIMHNMSSHFHNPRYFERPEEFDPTRFLIENGRKLHVSEHFVPFSYGKRNCLGDKLAISILFLFCTTLLQRFKVTPPNGGVSLEVKTEFFNVASSPYVCFKNRD